MAYFSHAFQKTFWGASPDPTTPTATGFVTTAGIPSVDLYPTFGPGAVAFADQSSAGWPSVATAPANGEPLTLVASSIYPSDKIGPFAGGYQETVKSKMINPKYVTKFYRVDAAPAQTNIIGIGATPNLNLTTQACCPTFYCDSYYGIMLYMKGSPALRSLTHNGYRLKAAFTGCCDGPTPTLVDPAEVMSAWMQDIVNDPILFGIYNQTDQRFVNVGMTVTCDNGTTWDMYLPDNPQTGVAGVYFEADGTTLTAAGQAFVNNVQNSTGVTFGTVAPVSTYTSIFDPNNPNCCAGLVIEAAFAETKFGNCTFQTQDHFEVEPLVLQASMVDETGDPCVFEQLCISDGLTPSGTGSTTIYPAIQTGVQAQGTGESIIRDLILSEEYHQNRFHSDLRIREILNTNSALNVVGRNGLYTTYYILHNVPRPYNPSGTYDADQYLLQIPMDAANPAFETFVLTWLANAGNPIGSAPIVTY